MSQDKICDAELPEIARLMIDRGLISPAEARDGMRIHGEIQRKFGLPYTLGRVLLERIHVEKPRLRGRIVTQEGIQELLGGGVWIDFWKFPADAHDRFLDRLRLEGRLSGTDLEECFRIQFELAHLGILKQVGEILVDKGIVDRALADESLRPAPDPERLPCLALDKIAVMNGFVPSGTVAAALQKQDRIGAELGIHVPIGRILFETGHLRRAELEAILEAQVSIGRLAREDADLRILKLSRIEEEAMVARLVAARAVDEAGLTIARRIATDLTRFSLDLGVVEVLWLQDRIPAELLADAVAYQGENLARLEPRRPAVRLHLAPSAHLLLSQRPADVPEDDFLFGQCARIAGAVDLRELEAATTIFRRIATELGFEMRLGQILFDLHGKDPVRVERLRAALAQLHDDLGRRYEVRLMPLSPLEREVVGERLRAAGESMANEVERAEQAVAILAEMGLEKDATEILLVRGLLTDRLVGDLMVEREARDRRLVGGWREWNEQPVSPVAEFFERAFSAEGEIHGWRRPVFGHIAVTEGFVDPPELVRALHAQMRARELGVDLRLGEVLVELGHMTREQVETVLSIQKRRRAEPPAPQPAWLRAETVFPEMLPPQEQELLARLEKGGVVDIQQSRELLETRAALHALGLSIGLEKIVESRGWDLEEEAPVEPVAAIPEPAAPVAALVPAAPRGARRMVVAGSCSIALVAGLVLGLLFGRAAGADPRPEPAAPEAAPVETAVRPAPAPEPRPVLPEVVETRPEPPIARPAAARIARIETIVDGLEARLTTAGGRTRVDLDFRTELPAAARLTASLARAERPEAPLATATVAAAPGASFDVGAPLGAGDYVVALAYRPESQSGTVALAAGRAHSVSVRVRLGSAADAASAAAGRRRELEVVRDRLAEVVAELDRETDRARRSELARTRLEEVGGLWTALRRPEAPSDPSLVAMRGALARAARLLGETLTALAAGREADPRTVEQVRRDLESARS